MTDRELYLLKYLWILIKYLCRVTVGGYDNYLQLNQCINLQS